MLPGGFEVQRCVCDTGGFLFVLFGVLVLWSVLEVYLIMVMVMVSCPWVIYVDSRVDW